MKLKQGVSSPLLATRYRNRKCCHLKSNTSSLFPVCFLRDVPLLNQNLHPPYLLMFSFSYTSNGSVCSVKIIVAFNFGSSYLESPIVEFTLIMTLYPCSNCLLPGTTIFQDHQEYLKQTEYIAANYLMASCPSLQVPRPTQVSGISHSRSLSFYGSPAVKLSLFLLSVSH